MTTNPLKRAIQSATAANEVIGQSFGRIGTAEHPRGFVLSAYRNSLRAMHSALRETNPVDAAMDVISQLRISLRGNLRAEFTDMVGFGFEEAARQLSYYESKTIEPNPALLGQAIDAAVVAALACVDQQEAAVRALLITESDPALILGDDGRQGVVKAGPVLAAATYWTAALVWSGFEWLVTRQPEGRPWKKQAIAALDSRTTDCCLRVHGQIRPLAGKFSLIGTPRYADQMDWSPFHAYCRTSAALYLDEFDDGLTKAMQDGAQMILAERDAGGSGYRYPVDAYGK
jgi:hypothetical protein